MSDHFDDETAAAMDDALSGLLEDHDIDHASLDDTAKESLRIVSHFAQEYGYELLSDVKQQMIDQIDRVPPEDRDGYRTALRAVAETDFGKRAGWTLEGIDES